MDSPLGPSCAWSAGQVARRGRKTEANVGGLERIVAGVGGALLMAKGVGDLVLEQRPRGILWAVLGGVLARRGITGHCAVYERLGVDGHDAEFLSTPFNREIAVEHSVTINRPAEELYAFWRDFSNLPLVMRNLESVQMLDEFRSRWVALGPGGERVEWEAHITREQPGELIEWRSIAGLVTNRGGVYFCSGPENRGTMLKVRLYYQPAGGIVGAMVARLNGREPQQQIREDLRRFKQLMEAGEVADNRSPSARQKTGQMTPPLFTVAAAARQRDVVQEGSEESFPASDAPSWTPGRVGSEHLPPVTGAGGGPIGV